MSQLTDIYNNPAAYLNGTSPLDVTGYAHFNGTVNASPDSFMWYDELHPSEQTDRVIAREFVDVVKGNSKWATYWSD
jgi:phospholipase/lecithinase/hemolysin